jgi:hypothetical protein
MDVFSTEQGIRLSFVKTSEFRGGFEPPKLPLSVRHWPDYDQIKCVFHCRVKMVLIQNMAFSRLCLNTVCSRVYLVAWPCVMCSIPK